MSRLPLSVQRSVNILLYRSPGMRQTGWKGPHLLIQPQDGVARVQKIHEPSEFNGLHTRTWLFQLFLVGNNPFSSRRMGKVMKYRNRKAKGWLTYQGWCSCRKKFVSGFDNSRDMDMRMNQGTNILLAQALSFWQLGSSSCGEDLKPAVYIVLCSAFTCYPRVHTFGRFDDYYSRNSANSISLYFDRPR